MKKLYIIGNGFDLAHNLKTTYWNFRTFLMERYPEFLTNFEEMYNIQRLDDTEPWYTEAAQKRWEANVDNALWSMFESNMGDPNIDGMLDFSWSVLDDMHLDGGLVGIKDTMDVYWREQYGFIDKLQGYVKEWAEQIDKSKLVRKSKKIYDNSTDFFLTFNYTDVLENTYNIDFANVLHVHGGVKDCCDNSPIMGHGNIKSIQKYKQLAVGAEDVFSEGEASIYKAIYNYLETIFKNTQQLIVFYESFFKQLQNVNQVVIFGVSFGKVDMPYLVKVRDSIQNDAKWIAYYYDDVARKGLSKALSISGINEEQIEYRDSNKFWT